MIHIQVTKVVEILHHFRSFHVEKFLSVGLSALEREINLCCKWGLNPVQCFNHQATSNQDLKYLFFNIAQ